MADSPTPVWQPLSNLPLIASLIDGQLQDCQEQLQNLDPPDRTAPVLDDALVERIIHAYSEQQEMLPVFAEQLQRWKTGNPTSGQRREIERLEQQLTRYRRVLERILNVAQHHKEFTVEKVLERDDFEVGLDFLNGKMDRWQ